MFAIFETGGKQYRVTEGNKILVEKIDILPGEKVIFDKVLLIEDGDNILLGNPYLPKARVEGLILNQTKGEKIIIFKKKSKKGYKKKTGHRQKLTEVKIEKIIPEFKEKSEVEKEQKTKSVGKLEKPKAKQRKVSKSRNLKEANKPLKT